MCVSGRPVIQLVMCCVIAKYPVLDFIIIIIVGVVCITIFPLVTHQSLLVIIQFQCTIDSLLSGVMECTLFM